MFEIEDLGETEDEIETSPSELYYMEDLSHPQIIDSVGYLFKLCVKIEGISGEKLEACEFQASFLFLPLIHFKSKEVKGILFPMNRNNFSKFKSPSILLSAVQDGHTVGIAEVDVSHEFKNLEEEYESFPDCFPVQKKEKVIFRSDADKIGEATFDVQFICLGPSRLEDSAGMVKVPLDISASKNVPSEILDGSTNIGSIGIIDKDAFNEEDEPEFDEYVADINGTALNIKIMRKKEQQVDCVCDCAGAGGGKQAIPGGGIGRKGSQVIFQMPTKLELCTKNPPNAISYNVGNCLKQIEHEHGTDKMKIISGKSNVVLDDTKKLDKFVLKIGKKDESKETRGRIELEMFVPKLLTEEDFKKPCQSKIVQTEEDKGKKKKH